MARALVIGANTAGLAGAERDARDVAGWLAERGFAIDLRTGADATRDGMLDGLRALVGGVRPDEPAAVYFAGHGGLLHVAAAGGPAEPLGYLVPADHRPGHFRGVIELAWSSLLVELTARTRHVTVIHDCCHAARTVRGTGAAGARARARAIDPLRAAAADVHGIVLEQLAAQGQAPGELVVHPLGNPDIVRFAAAGADGAAWEGPEAGAGAVRGFFTAALLAEARALGDHGVSWMELGRRVRARVLRATGRQRPELEGPVARRVLGLDVIAGPARAAVRSEGRRHVLAAGRVHGVEAGDALGAADGRGAALVVEAAGLFESTVRVSQGGADAGGRAHGLDAVARATAARCSVEVRVADAPLATAIAARIRRAPRLCASTDARAIGPHARITLERGALVVTDERGPLAPPLPADATGASSAVDLLARVACARALERLAADLDAPGRLALEVERVAPAAAWLADGAALARGARICVHVANRTERALWLHAFAVGRAGAVHALGPISAGLPLDAGAAAVLGAVPALGRIGFAIPAALAAPGPPAPLAIVAIATSHPEDLSCFLALEVGDGAGEREQAQLATLVDATADPPRDATAPPAAELAIAARRRLVVGG